MKLLASFPLALLALAAAPGFAAAPDPSLIGCWRAVKIVQYFRDGTQAEDSSGRCVLRFTEERLESSCVSASGTVTSTYGYRIERPDFYLATMASSTFMTSLIGSTREYAYRIDGDRLSTAADLPATGSTAPTVAIRVGTEAAKVACP